MASSESDWNVAARDRRTRQLALITRRQREQRRRQHHREAAPFEQMDGARAAQIGDGVKIEIIGPDRGEPEHREADVGAARRRRLAVDIVDQHQRAGGGRDPEHQRRSVRSLRRGSSS